MDNLQHAKKKYFSGKDEYFSGKDDFFFPF